jgi:hypothetical protein
MGGSLMSKGRQAGIWDAIRKAGGLKAMGLRTPHLVTLLNMADHECDQTGECYMCSKTVAEETGQNASRVRTQWGELRTKGVIFEKSRVPTKDGWKIYWGWNEGVFSKSQITQGNEEGGTSLLSVIPNHSGQHEPLNRNEVNERRDFQSTALQSEKGDQIGKDHPSSEQVVGILPTQRNPTQPEQPLEKPTFPFLIALLEHLKDPYKITHPGRKDSWPDIEARLRKKHNPDQLKELEEAVQWIFSPDTDPFWRRAIVDPQKKDKDRSDSWLTTPTEYLRISS